MEDNTVEGRHIQRISGHKSLDSIKSYARRLSASRKRDISNIFSSHISTEPSVSPGNFRLLPDSLVEDELPSQIATAVKPQSKQKIDFNIEMIPQPSSNIQPMQPEDNTNGVYVGEQLVLADDDDIFQFQPNMPLLNNNQNNNNSNNNNSVNPLNLPSSSMPFLHNCHHFTININYKQ